MNFNTLHRMKYIHMITVGLAIIIPAATVAAAFGTGGFIPGTFPPVLCVSRNADAGFYGIVLPISIIIPSGVTLLLFVFWNIHKVHMELERERTMSRFAVSV